MSGHVLIVDDEESICWGLRRLLTEEGYDVAVAASAEEAFAAADRCRPDLAMLDIRLPGLDGLAALERFGKSKDPFPIIVVTAYGSLETAVRAVERGAFDYLTKPFDLEQVVEVVRRARESIDRADDAAKTAIAKHVPAVESGDELLGRSAGMQEVFKRIALAAPTDASVLLVGESGTGKELAARAIHRHSRFADGPFVPIHLAALSPTLIESELFGHARGAFTGAETDRAGLLEAAAGGTVFIDEAAEIPQHVQIKLLRVLQERFVVRVGEVRGRPCNFRVVTAVNRDPAECVRQGLLRHDLLYRLAGFEIRLPPLRDRGDDVLLLGERFLAMTRAGGSATRGFSPAAVAELRRRTWRGNVRELRNAVEHAAILARGGFIEPAHLPAPGVYESAAPVNASEQLRRAVVGWSEETLSESPTQANLYQQLLNAVEPPLFDAVLRQTLGNRAAAADLLGLHRATLRKKLAERRETAEGDDQES